MVTATSNAIGGMPVHLTGANHSAEVIACVLWHVDACARAGEFISSYFYICLVALLLLIGCVSHDYFSRLN